jgi:hypothetical protein
MRGPQIQGARRPAPGGVLEQYVEDAGRAQRSRCGPIARRSRLLVKHPGWAARGCTVNLGMIRLAARLGGKGQRRVEGRPSRWRR